MNLYYYNINIEEIANQDYFVSVTVNSVVYAPPAPIIISQQNVPLILGYLQASLPQYIWLAEFTTDTQTGLSYFNIYTSCVSETTPDTITAQIIFSGVPQTIAATYENCGQSTCAGITAVPDAIIAFDCVNQCINFTDTTGVYSTTNTGGYGTPNFPAISNIVTITFTLLNAGGSPVGTPFTTSYRPTAFPFASICLTPSDFGITAYTGNTVYQLKYTFITDSAITCSPLQIPFLVPCCGAVLTSGLVASFELYQQNGNGNPTPTPTSLTFTDTTLAYSTTNPGGYGTPNPDYSAVSKTEFVVTRPDGAVVAFDIGYIPSATNTQGIITNENLGYGQSPIQDGVYKIVFNVYAIPASAECLLASTTIYTVLFQNTYNCLYNQGIALLSGCDLDAKAQWNCAWNELEMIIAASLTNVQCVTGKVERLLSQCQTNCPSC